MIHAFNEVGLRALDPNWAGGRPRRISTDDISPDGGEIAFSRFVSGTGDGGAIYRMKASGGKAALVTAPAPGTDAHHTMPAWSPDGKRIAYVHLDDDEAWGPHLHDQSRRHRQHPGHVRPGDRRGTRLAPRLSAVRAGHN